MNLPIALSMPGWPETLFILVVVAPLCGAKKLPELARGLLRASLQAVARDFSREFGGWKNNDERFHGKGARRGAPRRFRLMATSGAPRNQGL
jgi:mttA/Hcf106 family